MLAGATYLVTWGFQSAPPVKGAMIEQEVQCLARPVSIRAPREGGDRGSLESFPDQGKKRVFREP